MTDKNGEIPTDWKHLDQRMLDDPEGVISALLGSKQAKDNGGPAFPFEGGENNNFQPCYGMSLRDYFAGKAIGGIASTFNGMGLEEIEASIPIAASISYAIADAMIEERAK